MQAKRSYLSGYLYNIRHSGEGRNLGNLQYLHAVGQHFKHSFVRCAELYDKLDSGLRRNDEGVGFAYCGILFESYLQLWKAR